MAQRKNIRHNNEPSYNLFYFILETFTFYGPRKAAQKVLRESARIF